MSNNLNHRMKFLGLCGALSILLGTLVLAPTLWADAAADNEMPSADSLEPAAEAEAAPANTPAAVSPATATPIPVSPTQTPWKKSEKTAAAVPAATGSDFEDETLGTPATIAPTSTPTPVATAVMTVSEASSPVEGTGENPGLQPETSTPDASAGMGEEVVAASPSATPTVPVPATPTVARVATATPTTDWGEEKVENQVHDATPTASESSSDDFSNGGTTSKSTMTFLKKKVGLSSDWFPFIMTAGYLRAPKTHVAKLGTIVATLKDQVDIIGFSSQVVVKLSRRTDLKAGDELVVYRVLDPYSDPETGRFLGDFIKNLGLLRITEVDGQLIHATVIGAWFPFYAGESVKPYEDELDRWKQSRRKHPLPAEPIQCSVAGPVPGTDRILTNEVAILSAGEDQGVVAGMNFQLRKPVEATVTQKTWMKVGSATVFYVGPGYSLAKVIWGLEPILNGYRAVYQP